MSSVSTHQTVATLLPILSNSMMSALESAELIKRKGLSTIIEDALNDQNCTLKWGERIILHLRMAEYVHFSEKDYNFSLFEHHLNKILEIRSEMQLIDWSPTIAGRFLLERTIYFQRKLPKAMTDDQDAIRLFALDSAVQASALLSQRADQKEESFRANIYAGFQYMLRSDFKNAEKHYSVAQKLFDQIDNDSYKFAYSIYRGRFYKVMGDKVKAKEYFELGKSLQSRVTSLFDQTMVQSLAQKELEELEPIGKGE